MTEETRMPAGYAKMGRRAEYGTCPKCGIYGLLGRHRCPNEYLAMYHGMKEQEAVTVFAEDASRAAVFYAEEIGDWEQEGKEQIVLVQRAGAHVWSSYHILVEIEVTYHAIPCEFL